MSNDNINDNENSNNVTNSATDKKNSVTITVPTYEYELYLMLFNRGSVKLRGFRDNRIPPSILNNYIGGNVRQYIKDMKVNELLNKYNNVSHVKVKLLHNFDLSLNIYVEFYGILKNDKDVRDNVSDNNTDISNNDNMNNETVDEKLNV